MSPAFIAVVILMVVLIVFTALVLYSLATSAGLRIRSDMVKLLESYDTILDEKSQDVRRLQREVESLEQARTDLRKPAQPRKHSEAERGPVGKPSIPDAATYRPESFGDGYNAIRDTFHLTEEDQLELAEQVARETEGGERGHSAAALLEALSFESMFALTKLSGEEQLALLDESLRDEDWALLRDYCQERGTEHFDVAAFRVWLTERSELESERIYVRSDGEICEGVQIRSGNKLYDYSINEREIG